MAEPEEEKPKKSFIPILLGVVLSAALGGGGFYAVYSGLILGGDTADHGEESHGEEVAALDPLSFVPIEPLLVSMSVGNSVQNLRFEGHLEVNPAHAQEVEQLMPRIMDVLNSYLRAVEISDLRDPGTLMVLRAQMLRRVQVVSGEGRVRDLLVTKFLIS